MEVKVKRLGYSMREVAEQWGCCERTIASLVKEGVIPSVRFGRLVRIPADAAERRQETNTLTEVEVKNG